VASAVGIQIQHTVFSASFCNFKNSVGCQSTSRLSRESAVLRKTDSYMNVLVEAPLVQRAGKVKIRRTVKFLTASRMSSLVAGKAGIVAVAVVVVAETRRDVM